MAFGFVRSRKLEILIVLKFVTPNFFVFPEIFFLDRSSKMTISTAWWGGRSKVPWKLRRLTWWPSWSDWALIKKLKSILTQELNRLNEVWTKEKPADEWIAAIKLKRQEVDSLSSVPRLHAHEHLHLVFVVRRSFKLPRGDWKRLQASEVREDHLCLAQYERKREGNWVEHWQ